MNVFLVETEIPSPGFLGEKERKGKERERVKVVPFIPIRYRCDETSRQTLDFPLQ